MSRLAHAGVPVEAHVYPGAYHGFHIAQQATVARTVERSRGGGSPDKMLPLVRPGAFTEAITEPVSAGEAIAAGYLARLPPLAHPASIAGGRPLP